MHALEIISTHPQVAGNVNDALAQCIEDCFDCAQTCTSCADACLAEEMAPQLTQCIRLNLDCADACRATGTVATRRTGSNEGLMRSLLDTCALACRLCGEECRKHAAMHEHCRVCAEVCEVCVQSCMSASRSIGSTH